MAQWKRNDGYSGCKTAYFGDFAVVICEPDHTGDGWGYQAFDESDEEAMEYGECAYERYGFDSEAAVIEFVEEAMSR